jgi:hypothetical protein
VGEVVAAALACCSRGRGGEGVGVVALV